MTSIESASWFNEPPKWSQDGDQLTIVTGQGTEFWQNTYYAFVHNDKHFRYVEARGDWPAAGFRTRR